ncbi:acyl-CoA dehydrogenase [Iodidimonas nitroreducens]|uniref:3-sulfinopropanoyl-CoA desulfinase n=1 Tax=Iodidimonas nitroreducens TaxID=1236968 RepID=A0A5A7N3E4_9PROT|nr:acyl-CoA dehydrogenase family protein [Iodidimonas nitroreducens]GAK34539.1 acyl-CoA dehydrogenase [alpha proteobacterium Q-1]GER02793.1 acyl-CoA dehydrogenase [Iodidimonas nitroreducens]
MIPNQEQAMIRDMARAFAQEKIAPFADQWARDGRVPQAVLDEMGQLGLMGMTIAEDHGGAGTDMVSYALALMEIAAGDGGLSTIMSVNNSPVCAAIAGAGNADQKETWLQKLARGECIGAFCLTEPQAGSDAGALKTKALRTQTGWVLNGTKQFITSGSIAKVAIIFAVTDPDAGKRGISAFLVPTNTPGFIVSRIEDKLGQSSSDTAQIIFDEMSIPESCLLGDENQGYRLALMNLESGRIGIAAQSVGMAQAALAHALHYAKERISFGKAIAQHQAVGFRLSDMATKLEASRQLVLHAASLKDAGLPCLKEASMAKLFASEAAESICSDAIQTLGGYGYLKDYPVERIYRDVKVCQIYEGTSDIQKLVINRQMMA